jgi:hypothetical protein
MSDDDLQKVPNWSGWALVILVVIAFGILGYYVWRDFR